MSCWKRGILIIGLLMVFLTENAFGEGTRQYRPSSSNFGNIRIGDALQPDLSIRFATFVADPTEQLKLRIKDPSKEVIYYGFNVSLGGSVYVRIKDPNGTIVVASALIPGSGAGHIDNYNEAFIGPMQITSGGYNALSFTPTIAGDYVFEFNAGDPVNHSGTEFIIDLFDITVLDTEANEVRTGRLWSQKWAGNTDSFENPFFGSYYIYSPSDSTLSHFEPNGMKPFTFEIFANSTGPFDTGNIIDDRKSANGKEGTPEYFLFLNPPDSTVFPYAKSEAAFTSQPTITDCTGGFCIDLEVNKNGNIDIFIELNGLPGYQANTEDVAINQPVTVGANSILWNGRDNFGVDVSNIDDIVVSIDYGTTPTHIPIFDVESNPNGFIATTLKPTFQLEELHFDDDNLVNGTVNIDGCTTPCHTWVPSSGCCNSIGNARTVNTWWFTNKSTEAYWINSTNIAPDLNDDVADTVRQGETVIVNFIDNDVDGNNNLDLDCFEIIEGPFHGTVSVDTLSGTISYEPDPGYAGRDSLTYSMCDMGFPILFGTADVFFTTDIPNSPPDAVDDNYQMENTNILVLDYAVNDSDPDDNIDPDSFTILTGPFNGNIIFDGNQVVYVPNAGFTGLDSLRYQICDTGDPALCDEAIIRIQVLPSSSCDISFYNGFTPNGDGINDSWFIEGIACFPENAIKIFNRWGNLVFEAEQYNNQTIVWQGQVNTGLLTSEGRQVPNGTYFYVLEIRENQEKYTGYILLNR